jgi:integrative and conjugative element protein (TIGR02256 family)
MQYMKYWRAPDGGPCLVIADEVLATFKKYAQNSVLTPEGGGILLGYVREPHIELLDASVPTRWDKQLRSFFDRSAKGHQELADKRWAESEQLIRYVGEWHTHPEDHPTPSGVDKRGWAKLAGNRTDQRPVLAIIVGRKSLHVELVNAEGKAIVLLEEVE